MIHDLLLQKYTVLVLFFRVIKVFCRYITNICRFYDLILHSLVITFLSLLSVLLFKIRNNDWVKWLLSMTLKFL